jgi:hypothetical protein
MLNWETHVRVLTPDQVRALDRRQQLALLEALHSERESILMQGFCACCHRYEDECECQPDPQHRASNRAIGWITAFIIGAASFALAVWFIAWLWGGR